MGVTIAILAIIGACIAGAIYMLIYGLRIVSYLAMGVAYLFNYLAHRIGDHLDKKKSEKEIEKEEKENDTVTE